MTKSDNTASSDTVSSDTASTVTASTATWSIDQRCMNCGAARAVAPELIVEGQGGSVFRHQPETPEELEKAWLAAKLCPTQSIRARPALPAPSGLYPHRLADGVALCGHNARSSYGAHSYFLRRATGNLLVDSPSFVETLAASFERAGGIAKIILTHEDDVADAHRWAERFGSEVYIHRADRAAAPYATHLVEGQGPSDAQHIEEGVALLPVPGHTEGSIAVLLDDSLLFTGDSLIWSRDRQTLIAVSDYCMHSWAAQRRSLSALADHPFEQVFPGHGSWSPRLDADVMRAHLRRLVDGWA